MNPQDRNNHGNSSDSLIDCVQSKDESFTSIKLDYFNDHASTAESLPDLKEGTAITETTMFYQFSRFWSQSTGNSRFSFDQFVLLATIAVWFLIGVIAIVTTKLLATSWEVPPLLLTTQQMILSSSLLRLLLCFSHVQPWPSTTATTTLMEPHVPLGDTVQAGTSDSLPMKTSSSTSTTIQSSVYFDVDFILTGLFNSLDILASNSAFHASAASFVETVKASEPITTTIVALIWRIDQLRPAEAGALLVLISGVLLSTFGNAQTEQSASSPTTETESSAALESSVRTAFTVMIANLCFAFRALCQKRYRANTDLLQLNDANLLFRLHQMGAVTLLLPALIAHGTLVLESFALPTPMQFRYVSLAFANAASFAVYNGASCYVLSNVSVLHHSGLNCLRRMFVTIVTCIFFGISLSVVGIAGIILCFTGFIAFTHARTVRKLRPSSGMIGIDCQDASNSDAVLKAKSLLK